MVNFTVLLTKILRLRQCCNTPDASLGSNESHDYNEISSPKFDKILEILLNMPEDEKVIIFSQWAKTLTLLSDLLKRFELNHMMYHGDQTFEQRNAVIRQFKTDGGDNKILLMSLTAGGIGLDLSCANHVILIDSWFNDAVEQQAIDRVYRIGQTKDVHVHRLYMMNSIEAWMSEMKLEKSTVDQRFHQDKQVYRIDQTKLTSLLHHFLAGGGCEPTTPETPETP